jgi:hypothetical protein
LGAGKDVESEVAAAFGPFVVLLGQQGSDEPDDVGSVGEDADHLGTTSDLLVEPLLGVVRPDLSPDLLEEGREGEDIVAGLPTPSALMQLGALSCICRARMLVV